MTITVCSGSCCWVIQNPLACGMSQGSGLALLESGFAPTVESSSLWARGQSTVTESSGHIICLLLNPDLLLSTPAQFLASSPTQLPKLDTAEPSLSSRHSLCASTSHLSPWPVHSAFHAALNSARSLSGHTLLSRFRAPSLLPPPPKVFLTTHHTAFRAYSSKTTVLTSLFSPLNVLLVPSWYKTDSKNLQVSLFV